MVSFDNITANARMLCDLMGYDIDIRTVNCARGRWSRRWPR